MADDLQERLAALEAAGWTLTSKRAPRVEQHPDDPNLMRRHEGNFTLEKRWRGQIVREFSEDSLEEALERAEWQQHRIDSLEDESEADYGLVY